MKKLFFFFLFFICQFTWALVNVEIDSPKVQADQSFRLLITLSGDEINNVPDLTGLKQDFTIVGTERSMNYSVINGKSHAEGQWVILLMPKKTGVLIIPAIRVGQENTKPLSIEVIGEEHQNNPAETQPQGLKLETSIDLNKVYLNQQVIYTVKLYNNKRLVDAKYEPPSVEDALLVPLGNGKSYQQLKEGQLYSVEEQQYAIFPQKSGKLIIKPPTFQALLYKNGATEKVTMSGKPINLTIEPPPVTKSATSWLPAKEVQLTENYDQINGTLNQGDTVTRTILMTAIGVPAQFLPDLDLNKNDNLNQYPEKIEEKNEVKNNDIVSAVKIKVTYLLNGAGKIEIPAIKLDWFNTRTNKMEQVFLPSLKLKVNPQKNTNQETISNTPVKKSTMAKSIEKPTSSSLKTTETFFSTPGLSTGVAIFFALAWLVTLGVLISSRFKKNEEPNLKKTIKQLKEACKKNEPYHAKEMLIKWGKLTWPDAYPLTLEDIKKLLSESNLSKELDKLAQVLYQERATAWEGESLWKAFLSYKSFKKQITKQNALPPLYKLNQ